MLIHASYLFPQPNIAPPSLAPMLTALVPPASPSGGKRVTPRMRARCTVQHATLCLHCPVHSTTACNPGTSLHAWGYRPSCIRCRPWVNEFGPRCDGSGVLLVLVMVHAPPCIGAGAGAASYLSGGTIQHAMSPITAIPEEPSRYASSAASGGGRASRAGTGTWAQPTGRASALGTRSPVQREPEANRFGPSSSTIGKV